MAVLAILVGLPPRASSAGAAENESPRGLATAWSRLRSSDRVIGDLGGARTAAEDSGLDVDLYYNHFLGVQADGGLEPGTRARQSGSADLFVAADFERLLELRDLEALFQLKSRYGRNVNPKIGALSDPFDDADGAALATIPQFWLQKSFFRRRAQLRVGYLDQQVALDRNAYANSEDRQFMATFLDNNNAIVPLAVGLGATLFINAASWLEVVLGTADADADPYSPGFDTAFDDFTSLFGYLEVGLPVRWSSARGALPGKYRLGLIWDPRTKSAFGRSAEPPSKGDAGFYLSFDQLVHRERPEGTEGLGIFLRYGYRDPEVNVITHFFSTGFQYEGLLPRRSQDVLGAGMYWVRFSRDFREAGNADVDRELGLEVYYRTQVWKWLALSPDFQFIVDPGGRSSVQNAVVLGLRARVSF